MSESTTMVVTWGGKKAIDSKIPKKLFTSILLFATASFSPLCSQKMLKYPINWNSMKAINNNPKIFNK